MKRTCLMFGFSLVAVSLPCLGQAPPDDPNNYPPQTGYPQQQYPQQQYPQQQYPQQQAGPRLGAQDLSNLVAPVALYPDMLLSQVLAASTYPAEIQQAQQWLQQNRFLQGRQLVDAAKQQPWDPSVQALVAFPEVMNLLTRDIQWTTDLGNAFLNQQSDVMDAIQRLRASARSNGRLNDTPQQRVVYDQQNGANAIEIQPTDPQVIYPPVYNPAYVWGPPVYGYYPPLAYPGVGYGFGYGVGCFLGGLFNGFLNFGGWGWGLNWIGHGLFLNGLFFNHYGFHGYGGYGYRGGYGYAAHALWTHDPGHRLGVPYSGHYAPAHSYAGGRGYNSYNSGRSYSSAGYSGRSAYSGSSGYSGGNRQMQAYRGLSSSGSRGYSSGSNGYSSGSSSYRGGSSSYSSSHYSAPQGGSRGGYSGAASYGGRAFAGSGGSSHGWSAPARGSSSSHFSGGSHASSGGGHSSGGGGGHSGGGGSHSHGGGGGHHR